MQNPLRFLRINSVMFFRAIACHSGAEYNGAIESKKEMATLKSVVISFFA